MLGDGMGRGMGAGRYCDSALGARRDIDMASAAPGLTEQLQLRKRGDSVPGEARTLPDGHDDVGPLQIVQERGSWRRRFAEDAHLMAGEPGKTVEPGDDAVIVIGDGDYHRRSLAESVVWNAETPRRPRATR